MTRETEFKINKIFALITFIIVLHLYFEKNWELNEYKEITSKQISILKTNLENTEKERDSLVSQTFRYEVEAGRHEVTIDQVLTKYPDVYREYQYFYEHQTE